MQISPLIGRLADSAAPFLRVCERYKSDQSRAELERASKVKTVRGAHKSAFAVRNDRDPRRVCFV